jgi:DedD protein
MGLFSLFRKNKQESASGDSEFYTRAEEESNQVRGRGRRRQGAQANEAVDPVLPEKKRARRRLIGAIALVLAAIIGLPMILDSEPKPLANDITIQIPSKDKLPPAGSSLQEIPSAVGSTVSASAGPEAGPDKRSNVTELLAAPVVPAKPNASLQSAVNAGAIPDSAHEPKQAPKPESGKLVQSQPAEKTVNAARVHASEAKPDAKADKVKAVAQQKSGKYVIQVAALASQAKVNQLQGKLKSAGIKSYTQKVATRTGERIRIRVGPFASKDEADRVRAKIDKLGLNGKLVPA